MGVLGFIGLVLVVLAIISWLGLIHLAVAAIPLAIVGALLMLAAWYFGWVGTGVGPHRRGRL